MSLPALSRRTIVRALLLVSLASPARPDGETPDEEPDAAPPPPIVAPPAAPTIDPHARPSEEADRASQVGEASWYGPGFHGRLTANGEIYDQDGMTAAHRWLPFGTQILVTNLENGCSVTLRVTDRGPYHGARILDCSKAAAEALGFIDHGVTRIRWDVLRWPEKRRRSLRLGTGPTLATSEQPLIRPPRQHEPVPPIAFESH